MTDTVTPEPEQPFDPKVAARITAALAANRDPDEDDVHEALRQLAWHTQAGETLAEKCADWRGQYEEQHERADRLQALADERAKTIIELGDQLRAAGVEQ